MRAMADEAVMIDRIGGVMSMKLAGPTPSGLESDRQKKVTAQLAASARGGRCTCPPDLDGRWVLIPGVSGG
jgi:hypothetical protein